MFHSLASLVTCVAVTLCAAPNSMAAKQYRCFGKVQYRPCTEEDASGLSTFRAAPRLSTKDHPFAEIKGDRFARVISQELSRIGGADGLWRGSVQGNGLVELALKVFRGETLESTRYMGSVWLRNKTSKFRFRATLPQGKNWRWEIVAWAS